MGERDLSALARTLGIAILVVAVVAIAGSLIRLWEGLTADEADQVVWRGWWTVGACSLIALFGWWARVADPRASSYGWALLGPFLLGIVAPGAFVLLLLNLAAVVVSRKAVAQALPRCCGGFEASPRG